MNKIPNLDEIQSNWIRIPIVVILTPTFFIMVLMYHVVLAIKDTWTEWLDPMINIDK